MKLNLVLLTLFVSIRVKAQVVENVVATHQDYGFVITYDLIGNEDLYKIRLLLSKDSGKTFREVVYVTGDVELVKPGNKKKIYWKAKEDFTYLTNDFFFRVEASLTPKTMPKPVISGDVKVEVLGVTKTKNILTLNLLTLISDDGYYFISENAENTFIVGEKGEQIGVKTGSFGKSNIGERKKIIDGIPIHTTLTFEYNENSEAIPFLVIRYAKAPTSQMDMITYSIFDSSTTIKIVNIPLNNSERAIGESNVLNPVVDIEDLSGTTLVKHDSKDVKNEEVNSVAINTPLYYGLFIGVSKYKHNSADLLNLEKPIDDANALKKVMISKYSMEAINTVLLENPSRAEILNALESLSLKVTPNDNLLIFYAGHGIWDNRLKVGYWLPSDATTTSKSSWISNSTIRDYIAGINTKHTLLITDACFSGSIFATRSVSSEVSGYGISKIYKLPSRKAMTSGTLTTVPDESKFMYYLIKRLNQNTSKFLTTRQLFYSLETAVLNNTNTVPQLGVIQDTGDEGGDFIFMLKE